MIHKKNLKKIALFTYICSMVFNACGIIGDNNSEYELERPIRKTSTETTAEYDNSILGLYKGVVYGPKTYGTVKIELGNGNEVAKATIQIGDKIDELVCTSIWGNNETTQKNEQITIEMLRSQPQNYRTNNRFYFTGTFSTMRFSVSEGQCNYRWSNSNFCSSISDLQIEGHADLSNSLWKETSDNVISSIRGETSGGNGYQGIVALMRDNTDILFIHRGDRVHLYNKLLNENHWIESGIDIDEVHIEHKHRINFDMKKNTVSGSWEVTWPGGSNKGNYSCQIPQ